MHAVVHAVIFQAVRSSSWLLLRPVLPFFIARRYASEVYAFFVCACDCHALYRGSHKQRHMITRGLKVFVAKHLCEIRMESYQMFFVIVGCKLDHALGYVHP